VPDRAAEPSTRATLPERSNARSRKWLFRSVQLVVTLAAFAYLLTRVEPASLLDALARVPPVRFVGVVGLTTLGLTLGALRWQLLFRAFGAPHPPVFGALCHYYLVGTFYNTYLPGGVGGDIVRALASRRAWGPEQAATAGLATVLVDRVLGLAGLLALVSIVSLIHPLPVVGSALLPGVLGLAGAGAVLLALPGARWLAPRVPGWLGRTLARLPRLERPLPLLAAGLLSLATQLAPALSGHLLMASLEPKVVLFDSLLIVPLASAAAFLPITVSGAGVREALFVTLYESVGVGAGNAFAVALLLWLALAALAAVGGWLALRRPLEGSG